MVCEEERLSAPIVWRAEPDEADVVGQLLIDFRDHLKVDWPSDNAFLAGVDRLIEDPNTVFLLGAPDADSPPQGVAQVRFRFGIWWAAQDALLEDLFVREEARGTGLGRALLEATIEVSRERGARRVELEGGGTIARHEVTCLVHRLEQMDLRILPRDSSASVENKTRIGDACAVSKCHATQHDVDGTLLCEFRELLEQGAVAPMRDLFEPPKLMAGREQLGKKYDVNAL